MWPQSVVFCIQNAFQVWCIKSWVNVCSGLKALWIVFTDLQYHTEISHFLHTLTFYKGRLPQIIHLKMLVVSLTVHLSITLANDQLDAQIFNTFITILYMYMFRAISCSSSGGQIVIIQHLVSSLSASDKSALTESEQIMLNCLWNVRACAYSCV
jgi:hypothetical protein